MADQFRLQLGKNCLVLMHLAIFPLCNLIDIQIADIFIDKLFQYI